MLYAVFVAEILQCACFLYKFVMLYPVMFDSVNVS